MAIALQVSYGLKRIEPDPSERIASTVKTAVRCKVFVGNLHEGTSRMDLLAKFQQYGAIVDVKVCPALAVSSNSALFESVMDLVSDQVVDNYWP